MKSWLNQFDERQRKEIEFSILYLNQFEHGTDGHNAKVIIAKMAALLDKIHYALAPVDDANPDRAIASKNEIVKIMGFSKE